jgi:hypothetical protein
MSQPWILRGKRSGLQTHTATTESVSFVRADELLTAFLGLESAIRAAERPEDSGRREIKLDKLSRII